MPPSAIAGVSVACASAPWVFSEAAVLRALAAAAAATAVVGAFVMRRWDVQAGRRVAELTRARAGDEWRFEERVAELETDLEESRELRAKLEQRLRAKRAELAGLRNEHAALLRRYATAETERASALEGRRLLELEAAAPEPAPARPSAPALPPARAGEPSRPAEAAPTAPAVFSPEGARLYRRALTALARFERQTPGEPGGGPEGKRDTGAETASEAESGAVESGPAEAGFAASGSAEAGANEAGSVASGSAEAGANEAGAAEAGVRETVTGDAGSGGSGTGDSVTGASGVAEPLAEKPGAEELGAGVPGAVAPVAGPAGAPGQADSAGGEGTAGSAPVAGSVSGAAPASRPGPVEQAQGVAARPYGEVEAVPPAGGPVTPSAGNLGVPPAVAVVPAAPARRPVTEGGFDFFGTQKGTPKAALDSVQNEDLADVVGPEALAVHKAEAEAGFKSADERSRGVGQIIDLTAHDETEQIDVQGLRSAAS
ncbi:hypothetical protein Srubr_60430 [Streptomyces rubradiris]|uniref:Secreted protein n=1 Tax=Streptomyces rubradiris TaxID=285531 RepID=A0ABQ3RK08_STRRR|nr:hypothetical protein GCM10018792_61040 [Streptomyces rubradiris]GHI56197.1 hypothetical protein Srubr_60430 [Streptomyces rubradiris]